MHGAPSSASRRLDSLTGLRAFAAFAVFLLHIEARMAGQPLADLKLVGSQGLTGVTFFFALSGFVLTWSARADDHPVTFWQRRFARIYPAYLVALLLGIAVTEAAHQDVAALPLITNVTLSQAWIPSGQYYFALNGVSWSLSCEAFFYAMFPLLIAVVPRLSISRRRSLQVALLALIVALTVSGALIGGAPLRWFSGDWFSFRDPLARLIDFVLGITVALDVRDGGWTTRLRLVPCAVIALAAWAVGGLWYSAYSNIVIPLVPMLLLLAAAAQHEVSGKKTVLTSRPLVWLGEISYAFYLVHQLVIRGFAPFGPAPSWGKAVALFGVTLAISVFAAWTLHRLVERPMERRLRSIRLYRPASAADGARAAA